MEWLNHNIVLARGSIRFLIPPIILSFVFLILNHYVLAVGFFVISIYVAWFFRDPSREIISNKNLLYAAADGKIKEVVLDSDNCKIAIRMSPFDVHLNRAPIDGKITKIQYKPGKHTNVYFGGAEEKNEQNLISVSGDLCDVDILQITGSLARRLECWVNVDDLVDQGDKIGIIRFGSQTNMLITLNQKDDLEIVPLVAIDQQVHAGITAVAELRRNIND